MPALIFTLILYFSLFQVALSQNTVYAYGDYINGFENREIEVPVLNNDSGLTDGVKSLTITIQPDNGQAIVQDDNTVLFIPDYSFSGDDQFKYEVCNIYGNCDIAIVDISVQDVDFEPEAVNDTITYLHGSTLEFDLLANDIIEGDGPVTISILNDLSQGSYYLNSDNKLELEFERKFIGSDSVKYSICDTDNDCSEAYVLIYVTHGDDTEFYIPQGFSPNGDGVNDTFYVPDFSTYEGVCLSVVDSWGNIVFQSRNYTNNWNGISNRGNNNGKIVPPGSYYYDFKIEGVSKQITGCVYVAK